MVDLDYYSPYYNSAPALHKSVGILLLIASRAAILLGASPTSNPMIEIHPLRNAAASRVVHWGFYPLLLALMVSGYLISTADGRSPIDVFGWFSVPSPGENKGLEDSSVPRTPTFAYASPSRSLPSHAAAPLKHHLPTCKNTLHENVVRPAVELIFTTCFRNSNAASPSRSLALSLDFACCCPSSS